ncbi:hypothetical protein K438DRAFT_1852204 [Mycena galopus ATCC 62051]|nr:hypothetical protein K438DRAFT_1852204 [Mycena galopus ATCC 62051]
MVHAHFTSFCYALSYCIPLLFYLHASALPSSLPDIRIGSLPNDLHPSPASLPNHVHPSASHLIHIVYLYFPLAD